MASIGRYEIISELGRGAMGIVYKAHDPRIGRDVAIKIIRLADQAAPDETQALKDRLFREAQSAGRLSHPGIVTIYDIDEEGGLAYISMEFVEGRTLEAMMEEGQALNAAFLAGFLEQTAAALDYAHGREIVHRDIKPANMMITPQGGVKVTDFGIARIASSNLTQTGTVMGTPSYMSPEQVRGDPVDGRSDQFSLAVMAYELLTGKKPFPGDNLTAVIFKIVSDDPVPLREVNDKVPEALEQVVLRALHKAPEDRFDSCMAFADAFRAPCEGWAEASGGAVSTTVKAPQPLTLPPQAADLGETAPVMAVRPAPEATEFERTAPVAAAPKAPLPPLPSHAMAAQPAVAEEEAPGVAAEPARRRRSWLWLLVPAAVLLGLSAGMVAKNPWLLDDPLGLANLVVFDLTGSGQSQPEGAPALFSVPPSPASPPSIAQAGGSAAGSGATDTASTAATSGSESAESGSVAPAEPVETAPAAPVAPAPRRRAPLVQVTFSSQPANVSITVDRDSDLTCTSPCSLDLRPGPHSALASAAGFRPYQKSFEVGSDPRELSLELVAITGTALISSRPDGADVFVDGKKRDERTNAQLQLSPGYHVIRVEKAGAGSAEQRVLIEADQLQHIPFTLRP